MGCTILSQVENTNLRPAFPPAIEESSEKFVYGKVYNMHVRILLDKIIGVLERNDIEYEIKSMRVVIFYR